MPKSEGSEEMCQAKQVKSQCGCPPLRVSILRQWLRELGFMSCAYLTFHLALTPWERHQVWGPHLLRLPGLDSQLHLVLSWRQRMSQTSKGEKRKYPVVSVCDLFCSCLCSSTTLSKDRLRQLQRRQQRKPGPAVGPPERLRPLWVWKYSHKVCLFITGLFHLCL